MNYSYETRNNDLFIVTDKKLDGDTIILKLNNEFKKESLTELLTKENYTATWSIKSTDAEDKLEIELKIEGGCNISNTFTKEICTETALNEFVAMMRIGGELESCSSFIQTMTEIFNEAFYYFTCERRFIFVSDYFIKGYVEIKDTDNKVLGGASRFKVLIEDIQVCEYIGKEISPNTTIKLALFLKYKYENNQVITTKINFTMIRQNIFALAENNKIEYFQVEMSLAGMTTTDEEIPDIPKMKYTYTYTSCEDMKNKFMQNNAATFSNYRAALKPRIKLIDIDRYMINEFTV